LCVSTEFISVMGDPEVTQSLANRETLQLVHTVMQLRAENYELAAHNIIFKKRVQELETLINRHPSVKFDAGSSLQRSEVELWEMDSGFKVDGKNAFLIRCLYILTLIIVLWQCAFNKPFLYTTCNNLILNYKCRRFIGVCVVIQYVHTTSNFDVDRNLFIVTRPVGSEVWCYMSSMFPVQRKMHLCKLW